MQTIACNIALNKQVDLILFILKFALYNSVLGFQITRIAFVNEFGSNIC